MSYITGTNILMEGALFERQPSLENLRGGSGAHEAPYVALLIKGIQPDVGESPGARHIAAPLETE